MGRRTSRPLSRPIISIEGIFDNLEGSSCFSTIDLSRGFYQLHMETASQDYGTFITPFGSFRWLRMPMGLIGSLNVFQSLMEKVLNGLMWNFTFHYFDDCLAQSRNIWSSLAKFIKSSRTPTSG